LAVENRIVTIDRAILELYSSGDATAARGTFFELYNKSFQKAVGGVYGNPEPGSIAWEKAQQFRHNASRFSLYKADRQVNEIIKKTAGITNEAKFKEIARAVSSKYMNYQGAEYAAMTARARTSKQMLQFEATKHIYPNLEWIMTRSAAPREDHLALVGLILPIDHPFWQNHQPGDEYNCKCDWQQTREPASANIPDVQFKPAKGLEGNPNATGLLITDNHPYFQVSAETKETLDGTLRKMIRDENKRWGIENLPGKIVRNFVADKSVKIGFVSKGIRHFAGDMAKSPDYDLKNMMIPKLPALLQKAEYISTSPNDDPVNTFVKQYHYFRMMFFGKPVYFNIREFINGEYVLYAITDQLR
jgi:hypothetical protein